jgi:transcriptional regulator with XRE-family HTH domain
MALVFDIQRIKHLRKQLGVSQRQFAKKCGIKRQSVIQYESISERVVDVRVSNLLKIANGCNVSVSYFFVEKEVCEHTPQSSCAAEGRDDS